MKKENQKGTKVVYEEGPNSRPELAEEEYCADEIEEPKIEKKNKEKGRKKKK